MEHKTFVKVVVNVCRLAIVQGVVWGTLAIIGLLTHFEAISPKIDIFTHSGFLNFALYSIFAARATKILFLLFLYLLSSIMWIIYSIILIRNIRKEQDNKKIGKWLQGWGVSTIFICLYDIVAVGIFADEYNYGTSLPLNIHVSFVILAYGLLFTIAARGYILWCINLMFAIIFIKYGRKYKQTGPTSDSINGNRNEYGKP